MALSRSTCKTCGDPIVWGLERGGKWKPLQEDRHGAVILLKERYIIQTLYGSFDDVPAGLRARVISADTREMWKAALDGPRYMFHAQSCVAVQAMRLKVSDAVL